MFKSEENNPIADRELAKQQVQEYLAETGFPNSTQRIRDHLKNVFSKALGETSLPISYIACDWLCSLGEGKNNAIPGSDVDGLFLFEEKPVPKLIKEKLANRVQEFIDRRLVYLTKYGLWGSSYWPLSRLLTLETTDWNRYFKTHPTLDSNLILDFNRFQQVVYGTSLYETQSPLLSRLRNSISGRSIPTPTYKPGMDATPIRASKYQAREYLKDNWQQLTGDQSYAIARTMMQSRKVPVADPIDLSAGGKDDHILTELTGLGLFALENARYYPVWVGGKGTTAALDNK